MRISVDRAWRDKLSNLIRLVCTQPCLVKRSGYEGRHDQTPLLYVFVNLKVHKDQ